jgi:hypothetical protein
MPYDKSKVDAWIKAREPVCPLCKQTTFWMPLPDFVGILCPAPGQPGYSLKKFHAAPYVGLQCDDCGYLMLVAPAVMGLTTS